jgi:hypothetical protein
MEPTQLLIEYLKEQYAQARQHETRQTAATTFLTATAGAVLGLALKDGHLLKTQWWIGLVVAGLGLANIRILDAHQIGNRFHTRLAGKVRRRLEEICDWEGGKTATDLRIEALCELELNGPDITIGGMVHSRLRLIPILMVALGFSVSALTRLLGV